MTRRGRPVARTFGLILILLNALAPAAQAQQRAPVPVPIALPRSPAVANQASSAIFDAMLAISRAQQTNPRAAQNATFDYTRAIQQYSNGNLSAARRSALEAQLSASQPDLDVLRTPLPAPILPPARPQVPGTQGGLFGGDAPAIDADTFLALARGTLADCAARQSPALANAQRSYTQASREFAARNWQAVRIDAKAAIDACAKPQ